MEAVEQMLSTTPNEPGLSRVNLSACIDACVACELACVACADACLGESQVAALRKCIRLNLDCADVCGTTARLLSRSLEPQEDLIRAQLELCVRACKECGAECHSHAGMHAHCRVCGDACRACEEHCRKLLREQSGALP